MEKNSKGRREKLKTLPASLSLPSQKSVAKRVVHRPMSAQLDELGRSENAVFAIPISTDPLRVDNQTGTVLSDTLARATDVIGDKAKALRWMGTPIRALDFATPISLLGTKKGVERVSRVLGQMEHGIW